MSQLELLEQVISGIIPPSPERIITPHYSNTSVLYFSAQKPVIPSKPDDLIERLYNYIRNQIKYEDNEEGGQKIDKDRMLRYIKEDAMNDVRNVVHRGLDPKKERDKMNMLENWVYHNYETNTELILRLTAYIKEPKKIVATLELASRRKE